MLCRSSMVLCQNQCGNEKEAKHSIRVWNDLYLPNTLSMPKTAHASSADKFG